MTSVRNTLAIAGKELRGYFASPMGYILIGLFALLFGAFFRVYLTGFAEQSQRMAMGGGAGNINVNEYLIRGVMHNVAIIILFVMPLVTMRTYAEEKRSGTMELLLTSPITDLEIIVGKFLGAMGLFAAMLLVTAIDIAILFRLGNPELKPVLTGYLGLLLLGGCFLSVGLFLSSLTKNQIVAGVLTFAVFLMLWIINWFADSVGPDRACHRRFPFDHRAPGRFHQGHHRYETSRLLLELHHVRAVPDRQVRRFGTLARLTELHLHTDDSLC